MHLGRIPNIDVFADAEHSGELEVVVGKTA
jgi:hypothetical protein